MTPPQPDTAVPAKPATLFGHPAGLYMLFFAEMWERFSFYGMRALLILYLTKGFLGYGDSVAYSVYGAYMALVYMTPFFGGMLADRIFGAQRAVIVGGLLMAAGQACLMLDKLQNAYAFYCGLALLIVGNGFFKPNISNIVGVLYRQFPQKRDGGFTIFYMGINLGAAVAPLLCGYIGETYDWAWGFGLATIGMLVGLAMLVLPARLAQAVVGAGAAAAVAGLLGFHPDEATSVAARVLVAAALAVSAAITILAIGRGGVPAGAGAPPDPDRLKRRLLGVLPVAWAVYLGTLLSVPCFMALVSGGAPLKEDNRAWVFIDKDTIQKLETSDNAFTRIGAVVLKQVATPMGVILGIASLLAYGYLLFEAVRMDAVARHRMGVVLILVFVSVLFWAFHDQAGSSMTNFADRNINRVFDRATIRTIVAKDVGKTIELEPTQKQLGFHNGKQMFTLNILSKLREDYKNHLDELKKQRGDNHGQPDEQNGQDKAPKKEPALVIPWKVVNDNVGMNIATRDDEIPASTFQSVNPICIMLLGLLFTALWTFLGSRGWEPSTPMKFSLAIVQLGLAFVPLWYGALTADKRGMVCAGWLVLSYFIHTTAELCLSPVGMSMVIKLSPVRLVSTMMGAWLLAGGVARFVAGVIAQFTGVGSEASKTIPTPVETVHVYGNFFGVLIIVSGAAAIGCFCLVPLLKRWMHEGE